MNEQFSAFLDNEATCDESDSVLNALLRDEGLRESWSRQHWVRTTLRAHRGEVAVELDTDFADRVMHAITSEQQPEIAASDRVLSMTAAAPRRRRRWRNVAGFAAAASAAGVVFLVSSSLPRDGIESEIAESTVATASISEPTRVATSRDVANTPGNASNMVASNDLSGDMKQEVSTAASASVQQGPADHWSVSDPALEDELNSYLVEHNGLARGYGLSGTTPAFVRVATYGQEPTQ